MTWTQKVLTLYVLISAVIIAWLLYPKTKAITGPVVLPPGTTEQVLIDPIKHTLIVRTQTSTHTQTLPDRLSVVDVHSDGSIKITAAQYGFEERPFIGLQTSNHFRFMAGSDQFFYKKLDLGLAIGVQPNLSSLVGIVQLSYNAYNNTRLGITYDTDQHVGIGLTVRL